jgi:hypothetical protein
MKKEFWSLIITMVVGGLTYSIISFSYMHTKFTTVDLHNNQGQRLDRLDHRLENRLKGIDNKLDRLIEARGN